MQQIGTLEEKLEEVVDEPEEVPAQDVTDALLEDNQLTKDEYILLNTLSSGRYTYRSKSGLRKEAKINKSDFESTLNRLMANKLVAQRQNKKDQVRFFLTGSGREKLGKIG